MISVENIEVWTRGTQGVGGIRYCNNTPPKFLTKIITFPTPQDFLTKIMDFQERVYKGKAPVPSKPLSLCIYKTEQ